MTTMTATTYNHFEGICTVVKHCYNHGYNRKGVPLYNASKGAFIATQLNSTRRRVVDTFTA